MIGTRRGVVTPGKAFLAAALSNGFEVKPICLAVVLGDIENHVATVVEVDVFEVPVQRNESRGCDIRQPLGWSGRSEERRVGKEGRSREAPADGSDSRFPVRLGR